MNIIILYYIILFINFNYWNLLPNSLRVSILNGLNLSSTCSIIEIKTYTTLCGINFTPFGVSINLRTSFKACVLSISNFKSLTRDLIS